MHIAKASYFLGTKLLGQSIIEYRLHPANCPDSQAYFCATCGEIWGRIFVQDGLGLPQRWLVNTVPCEIHDRTGVPDWGSIPGSMSHFELLASRASTIHWAAMLDNMPETVLARELDLHLRYFERKFGNVS